MPIPTPQERLDQAVAARHKLLLGQLAYVVEADGRRVEYSRTNLDALDAEIANLRAEVENRRPRYGALGFTF